MLVRSFHRRGRSSDSGRIDEVFRRIWAENYWGDEQSRSGGGSNLEQTAVLRAQLPSLIEELGIERLLDLPCGDFHWMKAVNFPSKLQYIGADIVTDLIEQNQRNYSKETIRFEVKNLVESDLPQADLVFCRDCLVHLSYSSIQRAIANIKRSGTKYLLTTHFTNPRRNKEISTGQWRPLNWTLAPFYFPQPIRLIDERCTEDHGKFADKSMGLWQIDDLPHLEH